MSFDTKFALVGRPLWVFGVGCGGLRRTETLFYNKQKPHRFG